MADFLTDVQTLRANARAHNPLAGMGQPAAKG